MHRPNTVNFKIFDLGVFWEKITEIIIRVIPGITPKSKILKFTEFSLNMDYSP